MRSVWRRGDVRIATLIGVAAFLFYLATLAPSLVWGDGARLQTDAMIGGSLYWHLDELQSTATDGWLFDRLGIAAWDHPLWVMIGHGLTSMPVPEPRWLLNLLSAFPAAAGLAFLFLLVDRITGSRIGAALGVASLAVAHTFWFHAVTAEVYALHAFFMVLLLWQTQRWVENPTSELLVVMAVSAGVGMANHLMLALTVVVICLFLSVRREYRSSLNRHISTRTSILILGAFAVGFAPWWVQFVRMMRVAGLESTASIAAGFPWLGNRWPGALSNIPANLADYLAFLAFQFTPVGLVLGGYGILVLRRTRSRLAPLLLSLFAVHVIFSANYDVADRYAFHLPSYVIFAIFIAIGLADMLSRVRGRNLNPAPWVAGSVLAVLVLPVLAYVSLPGLLRNAGLTDADLGIPMIGVDQRDGISYYLNPNQRGDRSAETFGRGALESLPGEAMVLAAWPTDLETYIVMRHYQLTDDLRTDVTLDPLLFTGLPLHESVMETTWAQRGCRPLYLASLNPDAYPLEWLEEKFTVQTDTYLFRLEPRTPGAGDCGAHSRSRATLDDLMDTVRR